MRNFFLSFSLFIGLLSCSQDKLSDVLKKYNRENIPYITAQELAMPKTKAIILDSRESNEFKVSHLRNAIHVGYDDFNLKGVKNTISNKDTLIVVYCSIGVRSEDIAEELKKEGYTNVYNLFGGIFEWKNNGFKIYDSSNNITENIHAYSEEWSKWLLKGKKIYD
ncbi:rhodanese-like domain-containing protein [Winogradskyella alexanderae]|uniref:Rhodanese-like domain-containing protein n=1 Tax=Winogradskyella alexanderae TaxID=2877123 RepID=A0ABS7XUE8_9FLAO|nr:rhodanese-like domain-containing protein [Winogradskyella alexanderae]MCA0132532.1 rhodanese-like domain-containing protein [Winogradskyella alexanderae]